MPQDQDKDRNHIVIHYKDGALRKGYTHDFHPAGEMFHMTSDMDADRGSVHEVKVSDLRAVFFVKTLQGDRYYSEKKSFDEVDASKLQGMKIKVKFKDGEIIRGVTLGYNKKKKGFFVIPVDPQSNNDRIYVVADALESISLGDAAEK
jgi:hypothetical protein